MFELFVIVYIIIATCMPIIASYLNKTVPSMFTMYLGILISCQSRDCGIEILDCAHCHMTGCHRLP